MRINKGTFRLAIRLICVPAVLAVAFPVTIASAFEQPEKVLYNFLSTGTAFDPDGPVVFDQAGNLYGTAEFGGPANAGAVFELRPKARGGWSEKTLYNFQDGEGYPLGGVVIDSAGNLYGVTISGGPYQQGLVFELMPQSNGGWKKKIIHVFGKGNDIGFPQAGLIFDGVGNLYGVSGGANSLGAVFKLMPQANGSWKEKLLHNFSSAEGNFLNASLIFDAAGNLYGTTSGGGAYGQGTVFELQRLADGGWKERTLYDFKNDGVDGTIPSGSLVFDASGDLYSTTEFGGAHNWGTVFQLEPGLGGKWTERIIHSFNLDGVDGVEPLSGLTIDAARNLYGTTFDGGIYLGHGGNFYHGTVFEISPDAGDGWTEKVLHSFGNGTDGGAPLTNLTSDAFGNLFGSTLGGGTGGEGTVFEVKP